MLADWRWDWRIQRKCSYNFARFDSLYRMHVSLRSSDTWHNLVLKAKSKRLDLYPPQVNYPLCTIASKPRLPEHCIEYVRIILWPKLKPFGEETQIDGDDPHHIKWIHERSVERANEFSIEGVTYKLTLGVIKHIIPAVSSTNACIASKCVTEAFKIATSCSQFMNNYIVFNQSTGVYSYVFESERKLDCLGQYW